MCRLKLSRLFCLLFALSVFFGSFGLSASAASDNLIDSDLTTWGNWSDYWEAGATLTVSHADNIYRVTGSSPNGSSYIGALLGDSSLVAGHSYSLSFKLPGRTAVNNAFNKDYSSGVFQNHFSNCYVTVGVGYITSSGDFITPDSMICFEINPDNYQRFFGTTLRASFIASNFSGTPVVYIAVSSLNHDNHSFYFSDFKLVDNDDNSAELDGIKGFLHSIRWDLVGGVCEEEDCPHSSSDNPHLSLSQRMSSGFASMFQNIGDKFEEGSTLNTWFNNLSDTVGNLDGSLSNLGDRFQGFIDGLGENLSLDLGNFETSVTDWFSDLKESWDEWIDDIQQTFDDVGASIENKFQEIGDSFSEFFDKFKPRVAVNLKWRRGNINSDTGEIIDNKFHVITSELFTVNGDTGYYVTYNPLVTSNSSQAGIYQYDLKGNYIGRILYEKNSFEAYVLPAGYQYRFSVYWLNGWELDDSAVNEVFTVYAEEGWINALLLNMKMGIKDLFVPDEAFIATWKEELELLLQERLGIIWDAGDFFIALIQTIGDLLTTTPDDIHYELPEMVIELNGQTYTLWQAQQVDFSFLEKNAFFAMLYKLYKAVLNVFLGIPLLNYAKKEMDATLHN